MKRLLLISAAFAGILLATGACGGTGGGNDGCAGGNNGVATTSGSAAATPTIAPGAQYRDFPMPKLPSTMMDRESKAEYLAEHYWEAYFAGSATACKATACKATAGSGAAGNGAAAKFINDTSAVLGVKKPALEQAMANYIRILDSCPLAQAQKSITKLFEGVSAAQTADSTTHAYVIFRELVEKYMYDPNSPLRDEDYFLPYVSALATSPLTEEDLRPSYEFQAQMCSLNRAGTPAPDFKFKTPEGKIRSLYGVNAYATVLFFSNPGCTACKEITEALTSIPDVGNLVASGRLAIVNIYIDEELDKWREYLPNYPSYWICGYDHKYIIRKDLLYNVRAIPSLYLLDAEKKVICKDAPTEKLMIKLNNLLCQ